MKVLDITELEDGSAILEVEITEEEKNFFIEYAFNDMIKKGMKTHEDYLRTTVSE
jgi:hypothetical protein